MQSKDKNKKISMDGTKKRSISKKEILFVCAFSIMLAFYVFIFNQIDVIMHNQAEFGIVAAEVLGVFFLLSSLSLLVVTAALIALCYFYKRVFKYTVATLTGIMIAGYVQILLFNRSDIMNVNGFLTTSLWQYFLNTFVYLGIVLAPVFILHGKRKKKAQSKIQLDPIKEKEKLAQKNKLLPKLALGIAVIVFCMQAVGLISALPSVESPAKDNELYYFSMDEQLKLSKNDNIVIFILDRNDVDYTNKIFKSTPQYKDIFSGFTYYSDNIAQYPGTFPSVASLFTGKVFDSPSTQNEYMQSAWDDPLLFEALRANDYKINGLLNTIATFYDFKDIESYFDNIKMLDKKDRRINHAAFFRSMLKSSLHRVSPYALKWAFVGYIETVNVSIEISNTPDYFSRTVCPDSDIGFYKRLKNVGLSLMDGEDEDKNAFSFVHLLGSHNPFGYNEKLQLTRKTDVIPQTRGAFNILDEYFNQMKDLGIYKDSTVIVMADHGQWDAMKNKDGVKEPPLATLLIKERGAGEDSRDVVVPLKIDAEAQTSHSNFLPTLIEVLYNNNGTQANKEYLDAIKETNGCSYFDVLKPVEEGGLGGVQERFYYYVRWTNMNSTNYAGAYSITGKASNIKNWRKIKPQ